MFFYDLVRFLLFLTEENLMTVFMPSIFPFLSLFFRGYTMGGVSVFLPANVGRLRGCKFRLSQFFRVPTLPVLPAGWRRLPAGATRMSA